MSVIVMRLVPMRHRAVVVLVAVVPELGFVQEEEKDQPDQKHQKQITGAGLAFKRFGQQMHEGGSRARPRPPDSTYAGCSRARAPKLSAAASHTLPMPASECAGHYRQKNQTTPFALNQANARLKPSAACFAR